VIDRELVTRKMVLIAEDLRRLEALAAKDREAYLASEIDETLAERYLERMIGRMIDVNYHVLTESGEAPPRDYFASPRARACGTGSSTPTTTSTRDGSTTRCRSPSPTSRPTSWRSAASSNARRAERQGGPSEGEPRPT
jgi:hypothetical protein